MVFIEFKFYFFVTIHEYLLNLLNLLNYRRVFFIIPNLLVKKNLVRSNLLEEYVYFLMLLTIIIITVIVLIGILLNEESFFHTNELTWRWIIVYICYLFLIFSWIDYLVSDAAVMLPIFTYVYPIYLSYYAKYRILVKFIRSKRQIFAKLSRLYVFTLISLYIIYYFYSLLAPKIKIILSKENQNFLLSKIDILLIIIYLIAICFVIYLNIVFSTLFTLISLWGIYYFFTLLLSIKKFILFKLHKDSLLSKTDILLIFTYLVLAAILFYFICFFIYLNIFFCSFFFFNEKIDIAILRVFISKY
jgi:hypothetical protein